MRFSDCLGKIILISLIINTKHSMSPTIFENILLNLSIENLAI